MIRIMFIFAVLSSVLMACEPLKASATGPSKTSDRPEFEGSKEGKS